MHLFKKIREEKAASLKAGSDAGSQCGDENFLQKTKERFLSSFALSAKLLLGDQSFKYSEPFDLEQFAVHGSDKFYYISDYLTKNQTRDLEIIIKSQPSERWVKLHHSKRQLQKWGKCSRNLPNIQEET